MADKLKTNYLDGDDFTPKDINAANEAINKNTDSIVDLGTTKADKTALESKADKTALGTQCTFSLSGTTLNITSK